MSLPSQTHSHINRRTGTQQTYRGQIPGCDVPDRDAGGLAAAGAGAAGLVSPSDETGDRPPGVACAEPLERDVRMVNYTANIWHRTQIFLHIRDNARGLVRTGITDQVTARHVVSQNGASIRRTSVF